ncbi:MAG: hypothetical protein O2819_05445 [Planctomycetota bacterium]|nr:hypothetical protein [Planctomycetota bacterium]MDA1106368.1 hypothetical protein [Planctomycetota bacterium]
MASLPVALFFALAMAPQGGCGSTPAVPEARAQVQAQATPAQPPAVPVDSDIDSVLACVDAAAAKITLVSAHFVATRTDALTEESERRTGTFVVEGQGPQRRVAILVRDFIDGTGRLEHENRHFVYAEGWLTEFVPVERRATARQLALPDEDYDPLRAGEGPIPLPVGQRRADLEKGFSCELSAWPDTAVAGSFKPDGLVVAALAPRAGTRAARELTRVLVAWDPVTWQPSAICADAPDGSRTVVVLKALVVNEAVPEAARALLSAPTLPEGEWSIDRRPKEPG